MNQPTAGSSTPPRRRSDRQSQLARIAADLFCKHGYHAVGLSDIATKADITGPAIYRHFRNKQAILTYAAQDLANAIETTVSHVPNTGRPWEKLDAITRELTKLVVERRQSVQLYQWQHRYLEPEEHERIAATLASVTQTIADLLGAGRPRVPAEDRTTLATAALSAVASLSTHRTPVSAQMAEKGLHGIVLGVLATGLPPRISIASADDQREPGSTSEYVSRREQLVTAALRPIRERGFHAVTMEELGAAAGIGGSSVYRHFSSKAALLAAVYHRAADRLTVATSIAIESATDPGEALRRLVDAYVSYTHQNSDLAAVYLFEHGNLPVNDRKALRKVQREHVEQWVRLVMAVRGDTLSTYARLAVHSALNMVHDLSISRRRIADAEQIKYLVFAALAS